MIMMIIMIYDKKFTKYGDTRMQKDSSDIRFRILYCTFTELNCNSEQSNFILCIH